MAAPQQLVGAEQQLTFGWQHFGAEAQQVGAGLQQVAATAWQHGAGAAAWQHGAGAAAWQQDVCLQHLTLGCLQHLTLGCLQQLLLASAAPLNAARTANVAQNATNFKTRLIDLSLLNFRWAGRFGPCHHGEHVIPSWQHCPRRFASDTPWTQGDTQHCGSDKLFRLRKLWGVG